MTTPINPRPFIQAAISSARFPQNSKIAEDILVVAIDLIRDYRRFPTKAYPHTFEGTKENLKVTRQNHGISRLLDGKTKSFYGFYYFQPYLELGIWALRSSLELITNMARQRHLLALQIQSCSMLVLAKQLPI